MRIADSTPPRFDTEFGTWRKSSRSIPNNECVEVAFSSNAVGLRDTKNPYGPTLVVSPTSFTAMLDCLRD